MSSEGSVPSPPAGWYPDANHDGTMRFWDGTAWTDRTHTAAAVATTTAPSWAAPPSGWPQPSGWQQPTGWGSSDPHAGPSGYGAPYPAAAMAPSPPPLGVAKGLQAMLAIQAVGFALLTIAGLSYYGAGVRWLETPSVLNGDKVIAAENLYNNGWTFQLLAGIATFVLLVVWSYKGTKWAQKQGAELRHSPGWAIGGWFIPIASLVLPFQILNDLHRYSDPSLPRPIRALHRGRPGSPRLWGWYLSGAAAFALLRWSSTLFDFTATEADIRLGLALRVISPVASALSVGMLLLYVRNTVRRLERAPQGVAGAAAPYAVSWQG